MKSLGSILLKRKEKDTQKQGHDAGTMQLGIVGLCGAITNMSKNVGFFSTQYVDISHNG